MSTRKREAAGRTSLVSWKEAGVYLLVAIAATAALMTSIGLFMQDRARVSRAAIAENGADRPATVVSDKKARNGEYRSVVLQYDHDG